MSIFNLPTESLAQDSGISTIRRDQYSSVSIINPGGGGVAVFEFTSPANSWFTPRLSYFTFKFHITKGIAQAPLEVYDSTIGADVHSSLIQGGVQFRSLPAANCVQDFSHMLQGDQIENNTAVPEVSALVARTQMTNGFKRSTASVYRFEGMHDQGNSNMIAPGGALQPWNGSQMEFEAYFVPPTGLWASEAAIPGGRHRIALTLNQNPRSRVLQMGLAREQLNAGSFVSVLLTSITLNACHMVPDYIVKIPRQVVISIHPLSLVMSSVAAGSGASTHTLSVPPSTNRLFLAMNLATSGTTCQYQDGSATIEPSFNSLQVQYAGQSVPAGGYHDLAGGHPSRNMAEPYLDYQQTVGKLYSEGSSTDDLHAWARNAIYGFSFESPPADTSTSVQVRMSWNAASLFEGSSVAAQAAANLLCFSQAHQAIVLTYTADGLVEGVSAVVEL